MDNPNINDRTTFTAQIESHFQQNSYQAVIQLAGERLALHPHDVDATIALCHAWIKSGHLEEAMAILVEVEEKIIRSAEIYLSLGDICSRAGLLEESFRYYKRFLAINPHSPKAARIRDLISSDAGFREMKEVHEEQVEEEPSPQFYTLTLADLYISQGHLEMAGQVLEVILTRENERDAALQRLKDIEDKRRAKMIANVSQQNIGRVMNTLGRWLGNAAVMKKGALEKNGNSLGFSTTP